MNQPYKYDVERNVARYLKKAFDEEADRMITQEQLDRVLAPVFAKIRAGEFDLNRGKRSGKPADKQADRQSGRRTNRKNMTILTFNLHPDPGTDITRITVRYPVI